MFFHILLLISFLSSFSSLSVLSSSFPPFPQKLVYISQHTFAHALQNSHFLISVAFTGQAISGHDFFQLLKEAQSATIFLINLDFSTMLISFKI